MGFRRFEIIPLAGLACRTIAPPAALSLVSGFPGNF